MKIPGALKGWIKPGERVICINDSGGHNEEGIQVNKWITKGKIYEVTSHEIDRDQTGAYEGGWVELKATDKRNEDGKDEVGFSFLARRFRRLKPIGPRSQWRRIRL